MRIMRRVAQRINPNCAGAIPGLTYLDRVNSPFARRVTAGRLDLVMPRGDATR